jgi:hypothetical protein
VRRIGDCPGCGRRGELVYSEDYEDVIETVYICNNDDGFILPDCNVAQYTEKYERFDTDVDMKKVDGGDADARSDSDDGGGSGGR